MTNEDPSLRKGNTAPTTPSTEVMTKGERRVLTKALATEDQVMEKFGIGGHELLATIDIPTKERQRVSHTGVEKEWNELKLFVFRTTRTAQAIRMNSPHFPSEWASEWNRQGAVTVIDEASLGRVVEMNQEPAEEFESNYRSLNVHDEILRPGGRNYVIIGRHFAFRELIGDDGDLASRQHCSIILDPENQVVVTDLSTNGTTLTYQP